MALAQVGRLFKIAGRVVPDYALRPVVTAGVLWPQSTATDLSGRPVGARGWPEITLTFPRIALRGLDYWHSFFDGSTELSIPVTDLTLPDILGVRRIDGYDHHNIFTRGVLWRPQVDPGANIVKYRPQGSALYESWLEGTVTIRITELGRGTR